MASSVDIDCAIESSGPSARTLSCESVTIVAISRIESLSVSRPVISRSIQIRRPSAWGLVAMRPAIEEVGWPIGIPIDALKTIIAQPIQAPGRMASHRWLAPLVTEITRQPLAGFRGQHAAPYLHT